LRSENRNDLHNLIFNNIEQLVSSFSRHNLLGWYLCTDDIALDLIDLNAGLMVSTDSYETTIPGIIWDALQICKLAEQIHNHTELMTMNHNLKSSSIDNDYRFNKLFEMYEKFYSSEIHGISGLAHFSNAITHIDNKDAFNNNIEHYAKFMERIIPENAFLEFSMGEIILCLNNPELRAQAGCRVYPDNVHLSLYMALSKIISKKYDIPQMISLIVHTHDILEELDNLQHEYEMEQERQRLLRGDMNHEKSLTATKLDLVNVKSGADFEKYLSYIFSRLGYDVTQTKGSGDRGADLILTRHGVKYIIQAKFYSNPVGNKAAQEAHTAKDIYKADKASVITNGTFTKQATEDATTLKLILIDGDKLKRLADAVAQGQFLDLFS